MAEGRRRAGVPHPAPRSRRQLLAHRSARSRRPLQRDLLRSRPRVRQGRRTRGRREPVHRDLEPRLHAVPARRREVEDRVHDRQRAAEEEHRHRHGHGARRVPQAGRREHVRDRPGAAGSRCGVRALPSRVRQGPRRRRAHARHRRPRALGAHAHDRWRHARQRGPRLHPASSAAPRDPRDAPARRRFDELRRAVRGVPDRHARRLPGCRGELGAHVAPGARRGGGLHRHPRERHDDPRHRGGEDARRPAARPCPATRRSCCTTRSASRST